MDTETIETIKSNKKTLKLEIVQLGYRMPMTWPFLSTVRNAAAVSSTTSQSTAHLTAQQLLLAPRAVHRRRYFCFLLFLFCFVSHPSICKIYQQQQQQQTYITRFL